MPGIREVASEACGMGTRALRRPCSGVPGGEAARAAAPPPRPRARRAHCPLPPPAPASGARGPTAPCPPEEPPPPARRAGGAGARRAERLRPFLGVSPRSGRGTCRRALSGGGGGGLGVPGRPGLSACAATMTEGNWSLPAPLGRWAPGAWRGRLGRRAGRGCGAGPRPPTRCGHPGLTRPLALPPLPGPRGQRWSGQGRLPRSRASSPLAGPGQRQVKGLPCPGRWSHYHTRPLLPRTV